MDYVKIAATVLPITASALTYLFMRRKTEAEAAKIRIESVEIAAKIWQELTIELRKEVSDLRGENQQLKQQLAKLQDYVETLNHK